ncbi:MAG: SDR family oxidoreductase [Actinobacteria bacterium]|nr:MAG: SDR family oxidoreductase [Actinomycetota bacterium]
MKLRDKVCVVTGGVQGIGRAIVEQYVAEGARVAIPDLNGDAAEAYAAELRERGVQASGYRCDVSVLAEVVAVAEAVERDLGRCEVLVNNAGLALMGPSLDFPEEHWRRSIDVMETGVFFCCQAFGRQLVRGGGAIVNIASMNASVAFPMRLAYNAAKAAVVQMTEVLAIEWAEHGVRVNSIGPGVTRTELVDKAIKEGFIDERAYVERTPMKRLGRPEEIAKAALFLASEEDSSFVTGHFLVVDGGWTAFGYVLP